MGNYDIRITIKTSDGTFTVDDGYTISIAGNPSAADIIAAVDATADWDEIAENYGVDVSAITLSAAAQHPQNGSGDTPLLINKKSI